MPKPANPLVSGAKQAARLTIRRQIRKSVPNPLLAEVLSFLAGRFIAKIKS